MKTFLFSAIVCLMAFAMHAQNMSGAMQTTNLQLAKTIEISVAQMTNHFGHNNGRPNVQHIQQTMQVRSNCTFDVLVATKPLDYENINAEDNTVVFPKPVLKLKVISNNTGGRTTGGYGNFKILNESGTRIINNAQPGGDNTFSIQYQAMPGGGYPEGEYDVSIVYTATQS